MKRVKIWMRVGMTMEVDPDLFKQDTEKAFVEALEKGKVFLDGDTYMPEPCFSDLTEEEKQVLGFTEHDVMEGEVGFDWGITALMGHTAPGKPTR